MLNVRIVDCVRSNKITKITMNGLSVYRNYYYRRRHRGRNGNINLSTMKIVPKFIMNVGRLASDNKIHSIYIHPLGPGRICLWS